MIKRNFFISMLSGEDGISSKRSVMIFFVALFAFCVIYNAITGKAPVDIYKEQLFELVGFCLFLVFGEKVVKAVKDVKVKKEEVKQEVLKSQECDKPDSTIQKP